MSYFQMSKRGDMRLATVAYSVSDILGKQPMISPISGQSSYALLLISFWIN